MTMDYTLNSCRVRMIFIDFIIFDIFFSQRTVENSPESNYVPGSFSAKGRAKLIRSSNNSTPIGPGNLDKVINQVCVLLSLYIRKIWNSNRIKLMKLCLSITRLPIGWIWIKTWPKTIMSMLVIMKRSPKLLANKK